MTMLNESSILSNKSRRRSGGQPLKSGIGWILSFADMVTIILTFLVLIVGITTQDLRSLPSAKHLQGSDEAHNASVDIGGGVFLYSNQGIMAPVIKLAENYDKLPKDVMFDQAEIKNAIFQLEPTKSPEYATEQEKLSQGISIFKDNRGLVVRWNQSLLFPEGSSILMTDNILLLQKMAIFLKSVKLLISVEGHSNPYSSLEGGVSSPQAYMLGMSRARVVMDYLITLGVQENRFRLKSYGGTKATQSEAAPSSENSCLELVLYKPEKASWLGR